MQVFFNNQKGAWWHINRFLLAGVIGLFFFLGVSFFLTKSQTFCANSISCIKDLSVHVENNAIGIFEGHKVIPPQITLSQTTPEPTATASGEKHIYVDLSTQTLYAYQGNTQVLKTLISSGKWNPTPTGDFHIWVKLRATRMAGGTGDEAYDLPNVPYTMYFYNNDVPKESGFSLHGAYWHNNFGHPMSHGCVNMRIVDAKALYNWVDPQTTGYTTYATDKNPGTLVSVCSKIIMQGTTRECVQ